ncbi:MAG TPA: leucyl aminopeptidase [Patescibacteria group bacterium]|nr:leucyl aminopeptidase [Patescibacteria group bacterium]
MNIKIKCGSALQEPSDLLVVSQLKGAKTWHASVAEIDRALDGEFLQTLTRDQYEAKFGEWVVFPASQKITPKKVAVMGLGTKERLTLDDLRKIGGALIRRARDCKAKTISLFLPAEDILEISVQDMTEALVEGLYLSAYRFHAYKGKMAEQLEKHEIESVTIFASSKARMAQMERGAVLSRVLSDATIFARDLVNTPSAHMKPLDLADAAKKVASVKGSGISIKILDQEAMEQLGMDAALAIARGSVNPPVGVHLIYKPKEAAKKKIALVGKAVTFDSGGLSLKSAEGMATMKTDMAGAAAVIGLFQSLSTLRPKAEIHGIFLAVENMPSGSACRPGDVVKAMNGTTIEILNTDAEGRVTLADALSYAETLKPDAIVELSTLTGACIVALGEDIAGFMGNDAKLCQKIREAAYRSGESAWELPLYHPYDEMVHSKVADLKNTGGRVGGTITAGLFLSHFVEKTPWVHIDIAGPSYAEREVRPDQPCGGTGFGVRLLARYLQG